MFTWGSKYLFGIGLASMLAAIIYGLSTGGDPVGVISGGYKGGVGDHTGYMILVAIGFACIGLGLMTIIIRDAEAEKASAAAGVDATLAVSASRAPSYWGPLAAFGVACMVVGVAVSLLFLIFGIVVLGIVGLQWLALAWSDRATGDPEVNAVIRERLIGPFEIPMLAALGIGAIVIGVSRVLLAVPEAGSTALASVVAALIFFGAVAIANSSVPRSVITGVVALGAVAVLAGGIAGAVVGEREIVHHHEEHGEHSDEHDDHSEDDAESDGMGTSEGEGEGE